LPNAHSNEKSATAGSLQAVTVIGLITIPEGCLFPPGKNHSNLLLSVLLVQFARNFKGMAHELHFDQVRALRRPRKNRYPKMHG
jgi:hypothetical protein